MKIKLLPYDSCLRIGRQAFIEDGDIDDAVYGLSPDVFDKTFEVVETLYDDVDRTYFHHIEEKITRARDGKHRNFILDWWIPAIFVSYVIV